MTEYAPPAASLQPPWQSDYETELLAQYRDELYHLSTVPCPFTSTHELIGATMLAAEYIRTILRSQVSQPNGSSRIMWSLTTIDDPDMKAEIYTGSRSAGDETQDGFTQESTVATFHEGRDVGRLRLIHANIVKPRHDPSKLITQYKFRITLPMGARAMDMFLGHIPTFCNDAATITTQTSVIQNCAPFVWSTYNDQERERSIRGYYGVMANCIRAGILEMTTKHTG